MKTSKYLSSLIPRIEKSKVRDDLQTLKGELSDKTITSVLEAAKLMRSWTFKDKFTASINDHIVRKVKTRIRGNYLDILSDILTKTEDHISQIEKYVDKRYAKDMIPTSMTYSDAQLLQVIESISFTCGYTRKLMIYTLEIETSLMTDSAAKTKMAPAMFKWLQNHKDVYVACLNALNHSPKDLMKLIENIPDVTVDSDTEDAVAASTGQARLDPLALGIFGVILNPIYHLRVAWTDWQVARHESAKEEKRMLEYQILDLKNALEQRKDPKVQRALEYTQDRVDKLNYKIRKMEEEAA